MTTTRNSQGRFTGRTAEQKQREEWVFQRNKALVESGGNEEYAKAAADFHVPEKA